MGKVQCDICKKKCRGDVLKLDKKFMHKDCFNCSECGSNLETGGFFCRDGKYFCNEDYQKKFGVKCGICDQFVEGEFVTILGNSFHSNCFQCSLCKKQFNCGDKATLWEHRYLCDECSMMKEKENIRPIRARHDDPGGQHIEAQHQLQLEATQQSAVVSSAHSPNQQVALGTVTMTNTGAGGDTSDTDTIIPGTYTHKQHSMNGYTSTDSGMEKTMKSEMYHNQHSPEYSMTSGDESWANAIRERKVRTLPYRYGKHNQESYLKIKERTEQSVPARSLYCSNMINTSNGGGSYYKHGSGTSTIGSGASYMNHYPPTNQKQPPQFHRPTNFSYRSNPNIHKKGMSLLINGGVTPTHVGRTVNTSHSTADLKLTEEVKRLAHYPNASQPDDTYQPPIDRYDFPAPPSLSVILLDRKRAQHSSRGQSRPTQSTGDISMATRQDSRQRGVLSGLETSDDALGSVTDEQDRFRKIQNKRKRQLEELRLLRSKSGMSQSLLDQLEDPNQYEYQQYGDHLDPYSQQVANIDPISASRSPDASWEPSQKPRFDRHTFTSPSRDSRFEGRPLHSLSSNTNYSSTGGRTGTMSGYNSSNEYDPTVRYLRGYRPFDAGNANRGYMSCVENVSSISTTTGPPRGVEGIVPPGVAAHERPHSSLSLRGLTRVPGPPSHDPRTPTGPPVSSGHMNGHMTPSMTTSGYSMDATSHSIDESTLIGGSGVIGDVQQHHIGGPPMSPSGGPGYLSDIGGVRHQDLDYDTDNTMPILESHYPTVQSYLKPSNKFLRSREKIPPQIYPYEKLKISNFSLPKGVDRNNLETYLSSMDFEMVFNMPRSAFSRLPVWKRNDLKQKVDLY